MDPLWVLLPHLSGHVGLFSLIQAKTAGETFPVQIKQLLFGLGLDQTEPALQLV